MPIVMPMLRFLGTVLLGFGRALGVVLGALGTLLMAILTPVAHGIGDALGNLARRLLPWVLGAVALLALKCFLPELFWFLVQICVVFGFFALGFYVLRGGFQKSASKQKH